MTVKSRVQTITDEASRVDQSGAQEGTSGQSIALHNTGATTAYYGGPDVTADDTAGTGGFLLAAGDKAYLDLPMEDQVWAVCATGETTTIRTLETGA